MDDKRYAGYTLPTKGKNKTKNSSNINKRLNQKKYRLEIGNYR